VTDALTCTRCGAKHDRLTSFPGTVCLDCWAAIPHPMPTGDELVAMWGGHPRKRPAV